MPQSWTATRSQSGISSCSRFPADLYFDKEGNPVRVVERVWGTDHLYNPNNGKSVDGTVTANEVVDLVDGQFTREQARSSGSSFPGMGAVFVGHPEPS